MGNIIQKVRLTYTVDAFIKGENEDQIMNYIREMTPAGIRAVALENDHHVEESYDEFVLADVRSDSNYDIDITY